MTGEPGVQRGRPQIGEQMEQISQAFAPSTAESGVTTKTIREIIERPTIDIPGGKSCPLSL